MNGPLKKWVESDEYNGPDMTDFGHRTLVDENFAKEYKRTNAVFQRKNIN